MEETTEKSCDTTKVDRAAAPESGSVPLQRHDEGVEDSSNSSPKKIEAAAPTKSEKRKKEQQRFAERRKRKKASFETDSEMLSSGGGLDEETPKWQTDRDSKLPNKGSYADPLMQKLFNIKLPPPDEQVEKRAKRKVCLLVAFDGTRYSGFQSNPERKTLQAELELALYKSHFLLRTNFGYPHKYGWSNSARTDKGVHACAQVVSAKLEVGSYSYDEIREQINAELPDDVRVLDVKRVVRSFCARRQRSRVRYQYMIPSFLLFDREELAKIFEEIGVARVDDPKANWRFLNEDEKAQLRPKFATYRAKPEQLKTLREALQQYEGTHPFHNFTKKIAIGDPTATRFILSFKAMDPLVMEDGTEWIPTQVVGQSFLLNQIRKMVSLAIEVARGTATTDVLNYAISKGNEMRVGLAPAQGLFLEMSDYHLYNQHKKKPDEIPDLDWITNTTTPAVQRIKQFKEEVIMKTILEQEQAEGNFIRYLHEMESIFNWKEYFLTGDGERLWKD